MVSFTDVCASSNTFANALRSHTVSAVVTDIDYGRSFKNLAVETDYIIEVSSSPKPGGAPEFESFRISKKYKDFRALSEQSKRGAEALCGYKSKATTRNGEEWRKLPEYAQNLATFSEAFSHVIDSEPTTYLNKVTLGHVKMLSKKRRKLVQNALIVLISNYPQTVAENQNVRLVFDAVVHFFLTDHLSDEGELLLEPSSTSVASTALSHHVNKETAEVVGKPTKVTISGPDTGAALDVPRSPFAASIVPISTKFRESEEERSKQMNELQSIGSNLSLSDHSLSPGAPPSVSVAQPVSALIKTSLFSNFVLFSLLFLVFVFILRCTSLAKVTVHADVAAFISFGFFSLGLCVSNLSGQMEASRLKIAPDAVSPTLQPLPRSNQHDAGDLLRRTLARPSMPSRETWYFHTVKKLVTSIAQHSDRGSVAEHVKIQRTLSIFPAGAALGSRFNCWSAPVNSDFLVRGANYLLDHKKVPSGPFLFTIRGVDLFLTDSCPENIGCNPTILGGKLREVPTFLVNFRLPWGVLVFYYEIPSRFLPFLRHRYCPDTNPPCLNGLSSSEVGVAGFLMASDEDKVKTLKLIPVIVKGPWVVKQAAGGKPALIGLKLPVKFFYQPADHTDGKKEYLEADLDIVASSAARGVLSVIRSYTNILTIDLGFVVQGNNVDELPEQMLAGARIHGLDPMKAPLLPELGQSAAHSFGLHKDDESSVSSY